MDLNSTLIYYLDLLCSSSPHSRDHTAMTARRGRQQPVTKEQRDAWRVYLIQKGVDYMDYAIEHLPEGSVPEWTGTNEVTALLFTHLGPAPQAAAAMPSDDQEAQSPVAEESLSEESDSVPEDGVEYKDEGGDGCGDGDGDGDEDDDEDADSEVEGEEEEDWSWIYGERDAEVGREEKRVSVDTDEKGASRDKHKTDFNFHDVVKDDYLHMPARGYRTPPEKNEYEDLTTKYSKLMEAMEKHRDKWLKLTPPVFALCLDNGPECSVESMLVLFSYWQLFLYAQHDHVLVYSYCSSYSFLNKIERIWSHVSKKLVGVVIKPVAYGDGDKGPTEQGLRGKALEEKHDHAISAAISDMAHLMAEVEVRGEPIKSFAVPEHAFPRSRKLKQLVEKFLKTSMKKMKQDEELMRVRRSFQLMFRHITRGKNHLLISRCKNRECPHCSTLPPNRRPKFSH